MAGAQTVREVAYSLTLAGELLGFDDGEIVGFDDGEIVDSDDGEIVGTVLGPCVGAPLCSVDGLEEGEIEGA